MTPRRGATLSEPALRDAVRRSGFTTDRIVRPKRPADKRPPSDKPSPDADGDFYSQAREAFRHGEYENAARLARHAAVEKPRDTDVQQFLALALFADADYDDAANVAHAVLHRGPYWEWKTLKQYYAEPADYRPQLRALEKYAREEPSAGQAYFLLGYHYLMAGHSGAARRRLSHAAKLDPEDELLTRLLKQLDKRSKAGAPPEKEGSKAPAKGAQR